MIHCPYCGAPALLVGGNKIYPHRPDLHTKWFWECESCDAYVGCHSGTTKPLGRLANKELRAAKQKVHRVFDPLWKSGEMSRHEAYAQLATALSISPQNCHIGMFDVDACEAAYQVLSKK